MLNYNIEHRGSRTKTVFIYESIMNDIMRGELAAGDKIPSKRELAQHLSVSVLTVENAYMMLEEEGYISARPRSGFYVNDLKTLISKPDTKSEIEYLDENEPPGDYSDSHILARYIRRILSEKPEVLTMTAPHKGCAVLRNAIAKFLRAYRGMDVQPASIIIGSGAEYLYGMCVQLFGRNISYGIEDPSYEKIRQVYSANGAKVELLKMDNDGITADALKKSSASVLHVTPYHSWPSGVTASAAKRFEYLSWAENRSGYIIEDDFDSEFAFFKKPIAPLFSMGGHGRVVYMNTFTKSISPAIRTAYMILPDNLMKRFERNLGFYSCTVPVLDQYALAAYISDGGFERNLGRLRNRRLKQQ